MTTVADVPAPEYFGIFYIPESRMYEFHRQFRLFNNQTMLSGASPPTSKHGTIPVWPQLCAFMDNVNAFMYTMNEATKKFTFGTSIMHNGKSISMLDYSFTTLFPKVPLFTSKEKALEFLLDVTRILDSSFITCYAEVRYGKVNRIEPEELVIVKWPIDKVLSLSTTEAFLINPYVPAFFLN